MNTPIDMANHSVHIIGTICGDIGEITPLWNKTNNVLRPRLNVKMLIIIRNSFNALECFTNGHVWKESLSNTMCGARMVEIKSSIRTNTNNQNSLTEFRDSIIGEIIQMRYHHITGLDVLKIFYYLLDCTPAISG